ncbi:MAG: hypothetical protein WBV33_19955 [Terracidiphilus sp.]
MFVVADLEAAVCAMERIPIIRRSRHRQAFETRFGARPMCPDDPRVCQRLAQARHAAA